ncbi:hypothetical protein CAK95_18355 [Pseudorhodoplanes sinuspersici]|uniref:Uncharacterized protein n=2 Tax=Pseudorhodoplanes sinuspersici TaxID=1235591 RepID=A0A1W6ZUN3_9HYPH|nr:hypothetical protein CAK95_18355 [Pseudorhodoplanes sinuspersici]
MRGGRVTINRGGGGPRIADGGRNWDGNRWAGGGRNWHRGRYHRRGRGYGYAFYGAPFIGAYAYGAPYYSSYYGDDECYELQRVATPYGLRWRQVWVCD